MNGFPGTTCPGAILAGGLRDVIAACCLSLPALVIDRDHVTARNIRHFDYPTETGFAPACRDRTFDLRRPNPVAFKAVYGMSPALVPLFVTCE